MKRIDLYKEIKKDIEQEFEDNKIDWNEYQTLILWIDKKIEWLD